MQLPLTNRTEKRRAAALDDSPDHATAAATQAAESLTVVDAKAIGASGGGDCGRWLASSRLIACASRGLRPRRTRTGSSALTPCVAETAEHGAGPHRHRYCRALQRRADRRARL